MVDNVSLYASVRHNFREKLGISATNIWENKPAGAKDWNRRQSCFTRQTLSFRIADIRKVGLKFKLLLKKSILKHEKKKNQPVATRNQFEIQMLVMTKNNSLGFLVVKHMLRGEGREDGENFILNPLEKDWKEFVKNQKLCGSVVGLWVKKNF